MFRNWRYFGSDIQIPRAWISNYIIGLGLPNTPTSESICVTIVPALLNLNLLSIRQRQTTIMFTVSRAYLWIHTPASEQNNITFHARYIQTKYTTQKIKQPCTNFCSTRYEQGNDFDLTPYLVNKFIVLTEILNMNYWLPKSTFY